MSIKQLHRVEQPREKLERYGAGKLRNLELLTILLRTGLAGTGVLDPCKKKFTPKEIANNTKEEIYYKWTHCGDEIFWNTHKKLTHCHCKRIYVDGGEHYVRVGGKEEERKVITK